MDRPPQLATVFGAIKVNKGFKLPPQLEAR